MPAEAGVMPPLVVASGQRVRSSLATPVCEFAVMALIVALVTVRFFTERFVLLPRALNAVDLFMTPLLFIPAVVLWLARPSRLRGRGIALLAGALVLAWGIAWIVNAAVVNWLGAAFLIVGLLTPIAFFLIVINLPLSHRFPAKMERLLFKLTILNCVIATFDAVRSFGTMADDFIFGTFGVNQNQLAFFLAVMLSFFLGLWRNRLLSWRGKLLTVWSGALFILCGFQTLWVVFAVAMVIVHIVVSGIDRRVIGLVVLAVAVPLVTLKAFQFQRFNVGRELTEMVLYFPELGKVQLVEHAWQILEERPAAAIWGVGPAVFNSRAFRNIAIIPYGSVPGMDVAAAVVTPFYRSELSARFIVPYFVIGRTHISGANTDGPFTSYVSVPVELGLLGAIPLFAIYGYVLFLLVRDARRASDPWRRSVAIWALGALLMLLGIATIDNYLEVTRYTMLVWLCVALWYLTVHHSRVYLTPHVRDRR